VAVSGTLAKSGAVSGAKAYPARISIPGDLERAQLRLGMPGSATVFAGQGRRDRALDVDPGVDQLLRRVSVRPGYQSIFRKSGLPVFRRKCDHARSWSACHSTLKST